MSLVVRWSSYIVSAHPLGRWWSVLAGLLLGGMVAPVLYVEYTAWATERARIETRRLPVIQTQTSLVERSQSTAVVHVVGEKLRDCRYQGLQAYVLDGGRMRSTTVARVNGTERNTNRPLGPFDAGQWSIEVPRNLPAVIWATYDCDGVAVFSVFARIDRDDGAE